MESFEHRGLTIEIRPDEDAESPREWCNLGTMVCWHRRYRLGDDNAFDDPAEFHEWWKEHGEGGELLPLYLYDHSGITMSTGSFGDPWDSGQVGWIYATRETLLKEYSCKRISKLVRERARKCLLAEVESYDQFLTGDVWCYHITSDDIDDSCCGFFGYDYCREEAISVANYHADEHESACAAEQSESDAIAQRNEMCLSVWCD